MKTAQKVLGFLFSLVLVSGLASAAHAAQVQNMSVDLSITDPAVSSTHTIEWDNQSSVTAWVVSLQYCDEPSDVCNIPTNIDTTSAAKGTLVNMVTGDWSLVNTTNAKPKFENTNAGEDLTTDTVSLQMTSITNHTIGDCNAVGNGSTDTCYVRLQTFNDSGLSTDFATYGIDEGVATVTVVAQVSIDARVDPLFSFTVDGDTGGNVHSAITTSTGSTYSDLDFGNLTANEPRYIGHMLTVTTNTENGYSITMRMESQMTGTYASNNVDPFKSTFAAPTTWTEPTGDIPNQDTAWIGYNTTDFGSGDNDDDVEEFDGSQLFGPTNSTDNLVMEEASSDNGATPTYVTYGLEANVFQPADTYNGQIVYTALPVY